MTREMIDRAEALKLTRYDPVLKGVREDWAGMVADEDGDWVSFDAIAALPAVTVGAIIAKVPTRYQTVNGDRLLHESDILAALEPVAAPDPVHRPTMTDMMVDPDTLDAFMEANPLPPDPAPAKQVTISEAEAIREAALREAWEKAYWRMRSYAVHDNDCKLNKPPRFNGPCSCGLTAALEEALALIQKGTTDDHA